MPVFLLFLLYLTLFAVWLRSNHRLDIDGLNKPFLFVVFLVKIAAGVLYGYIHHDYFKGGDTFFYFEDSRRIYETFLDYPEYYLRSIFGISPPPPPVGSDVFTYPESAIFWKDFGTYVLVHLHAIIQLFSGGYYSVHIIFMAFLGLLAGINFYRVFRREWDIPTPFLLIICFFLPSVLFWTSGLHKDILVYWGLSLVILAATAPLKPQNGILILGIIVIGLFRHYLLLLLLPALIGYFWSKTAPQRTWQRFAFLYGSLLLMAVVLQALGAPLTGILVKQQAMFVAEGGSSSVPFQPLDNSFYSVFMALPSAFMNVAMRPFLWECRDFWQVLAALEITAIWLLIVLALFYFKASRWQNPLVGFVSFYALSNWLLIGLLVANTGTIVRYRAIALGLLVMVLLQGINYARIRLPFGKLHRRSNSSSFSSAATSQTNTKH